jgi:hypothetical protein
MTARSRLDEHVVANDLGIVLFAPVAVRLDKTTIAEPDLIFVAVDRAKSISKLSIDTAPNLLIEILSPSTAKRDRTVKARLYARLGVDHYWIVDPEAQQIEAFEREGDVYREVAIVEGDATFSPEFLPGLRIVAVGAVGVISQRCCAAKIARAYGNRPNDFAWNRPAVFFLALVNLDA